MLRFVVQIRAFIVLASALIIIGCGRAEKLASTQTQRLKETENQIAEDLTQQGWELSKGGLGWGARYTGSELSTEMIARLLDFYRFANLDLNNQKVTSEHIKLISQIEGLMQLNLSGTEVTDEDLATLNACPMLMKIDMTDTNVTKDAADAWVKARLTNKEIVVFTRNATIKTD